MGLPSDLSTLPPHALTLTESLIAKAVCQIQGESFMGASRGSHLNGGVELCLGTNPLMGPGLQLKPGWSRHWDRLKNSHSPPVMESMSYSSRGLRRKGVVEDGPYMNLKHFTLAHRHGTQSASIGLSDV